MVLPFSLCPKGRGKRREELLTASADSLCPVCPPRIRGSVWFDIFTQIGIFREQWPTFVGLSREVYVKTYGWNKRECEPTAWRTFRNLLTPSLIIEIKTPCSIVLTSKNCSQKNFILSNMHPRSGKLSSIVDHANQKETGSRKLAQWTLICGDLVITTVYHFLATQFRCNNLLVSVRVGRVLPPKLCVTHCFKSD